MRRIAVFGLGSIGSRHIRNLLEMGETALLGCDVRTGDEGFMPDLPIPITSAASMVWDWKPDVVLVCVPPVGHYAMASDAIQASAHCFIEKPMATTVLECEHLNFQAKQKGVQLAVGYQLPFNPMQFTRWTSWRFTRWTPCELLRLTHTQDMSQWPSLYEKNMLDEFAHEISLACFIHGPVKELVAYERHNGLRWNIELQHLHARSSIQLFAGPGPYLRTAHTDEHLAWHFDTAQNDQAYKDELRAFLDVCQGKAWDERLCTAAEAAHVVRVIHGCRESAAGCNVVRI